ncbi:MAG TPA: secondary thiamine-phosphate synthase enzyme YjbQ [Candidatus Nitrosocosmicus sp.]|nr:secondary thiamine-phosphate synthase enzyme YjbQ [Candidatus Nitrosocosmicus sp.]
MPVVTNEYSIKTSGEKDIVDVTELTARTIKDCRLQSGIITVFVVGSTAAITTIEYEPGLKKDFAKALDNIVPKGLPYEHDKTWHDGNSHSHIRSSLIGASLTIPFIKGHLSLGIWQQIILIELDTRPRERKIVMQIIGE